MQLVSTILWMKARNILNGKGIWTVKSYFIAPLYFADYLSKSDVLEQGCLWLTLCNMNFIISSHSAKLHPEDVLRTHPQRDALGTYSGRQINP